MNTDGMNLLASQPDTLVATLWLQRLARDFTRFPANPKWSELEWLEKAFLNKFPGCTVPYFEFKKEEEKRWGANFNNSFKKHSLARFVAENFERNEMTEL